MKFSWVKRSDKLVRDNSCIFLLSKICMVSIREGIILNPLFQFSEPLLVILSISRYVDFGDTREVLLIGP